MEGEFHFLMICPTYGSKSKITLDTIYSSFPNVKVLDAKEQFIWLMSQDVACTQEIAKFITQCIKLREKELDILLMVVGWRSCLTQCRTVTEVKHGRARSGVGWVTA